VALPAKSGIIGKRAKGLSLGRSSPVSTWGGTMRKHLSLTASLIGVVALSLSAIALAQAAQGDKIKVLIIDGQNNHDWKSTTPLMKKVLEESGRFPVDVATTPQKPALPGEPKDPTDPVELAKYKDALLKYADALAAFRKGGDKFNPDLTKYDVVLSNYNGAPWPTEVNKSLEENLKSGKVGLVIVHAANNSFGNWNEYNDMIGMGWRGPSAGERLYLADNGKEVRVANGQGDGSGHRYGGTLPGWGRDPRH